MHIEVTPM